MNIIVCAKQVVDVSEIKIDSDNKPRITGIPKKISDFDKNALEEALKIKEKNGGTITILTVGTADAKEKIKELLAMGADKAVLVTTDHPDQSTTPHLLKAAIEHIGEYDLIICGEASIDQFSGQTGPYLAGLLNISQLTYAIKTEATEQHIICHRDLGDETLIEQSSYPTLITVTKEINQPRLPNIMAIMASANKPIEEIQAEELKADVCGTLSQTDLSGVKAQRKNIVYQDDIENAVETIVEELDKQGVFS